MFLYYCAPHGDVKKIARAGLRLPDGSRTNGWYDDLEAAEAGCPGRVLVVLREAYDSARRENGTERVIPASAFVNADPFLPPRRVDAGGGYLVRSGTFEPEILLIFRRGKWDLPKGKRHDDESNQDCAIREVREELGITRVRLVAPLGQTVHGYRERGRFRVKTTHWYLMKTPEVRFTPQGIEDIERAEWMTYSSAMQIIGFPTLAHHMHLVKPLVFEHVDW